MPVTTGDTPAYAVKATDSQLNTYQLFSLVNFSALFTDPSGNPVDPRSVAIYVQDPNGVQKVYFGSELTRVSVGLYTFQLTVEVVGPWVYKWQGQTDVEITSVDVYFAVAQSVFTTFITPPSGTVGQPMGLLLALTYAS